MRHAFLFDGSSDLRIALVGAGGTGSQMLTGLSRMAVALESLQLMNLHVTVFDPDTVSAANVGRQLFSPSDVGAHKAQVLVNRINQYFGLSWKAVNEEFCQSKWRNDYLHKQLLISCVDTKKARVEIFEATRNDSAYWLDLGNTSNAGQAVLGNSNYSVMSPAARKKWTLLPTVMDLFPEMGDLSTPEDDEPSCSLAEALKKQDLMVNQIVATHALELLWQLLRHKEIANHGFFFKSSEFTLQPLPIDKNLWNRYRKDGKKRTQLAA